MSNPFWVYFCWWCDKVVLFNSFTCSCLVFPKPFIEEAVVFLVVYSCFLCHGLIAHISGFTSELSILFHSSVCWLFCQYHAVLVTIALWYNLKSGTVIPPAIVFFLRLFLPFIVLYFCTHFRVICLSSVKNAISIVIRIALSLRLPLVLWSS